MHIEICQTPMTWPGEVGELRDCNALLGDADALRQRLAADGYLLIRGFHDRDAVLAAGRRMLAGIEPDGPARETMKAIAATPEMMAVLEAPRLFRFFADHFGEPVLTFDNKWLRAVPPEGFTNIHLDIVFMGRGSQRLRTVWTPFGDIPVRQGTLAICVGTRNEAFERLKATYGRIDVDRDPVNRGWFSRDPHEITRKFGGQWCTTEVAAGDIIIIGMQTLHCSTRNLTDKIRLSCDTRFQPAADAVDPRWYGPEYSGHTGPPMPPSERRDMEDLKVEWGI